MMRRIIFAHLLLIGASSFVPLSTTPSPIRPSCALEARKENKPADCGLARFFGVVATVSLLSFGTIPNAQASVNCNVDEISAFSSSSVEIAEEIKILDMSMPSYGDISDYKATVTNTKSLSIDPSKEKVGLPVSTSKKSSSMSSSSGSPAASFLPSMNKKSAVDKNAEKARKYSSNPEYDF